MSDRTAPTAKGASSVGNGVKEEQGGRPSSVNGKQTRTTQPEAAIWTQSADPSTALEVDILILDYLAYQTTTACLDSREETMEKNTAHKASSSSLDSDIRTTNDFLHLFHARHPSSSPDVELRFRIQLLKLVTLFTQRCTHNLTTPSSSSLTHLRTSNRRRAQRWHSDNPPPIPTPSFSPIPEDDLSRNRAHVLHALHLPPEDELYTDAHYGTSSSLNLLDLLPLFMRVSAHRNSMSNSNLTDMWMRMAGEWMVQATLEQVLVIGVQEEGEVVEVVKEAFAWGWKEEEDGEKMAVSGDGGDEDEEARQVNDMFEDTEYVMEVEGWAEIKAASLALLSPSPRLKSQKGGEGADGATHENMDWPHHLESLAISHPIRSFETTVLTFLSALSASLPVPVLVQLEKGEPLDGMTLQETKEFLVECGLGGVSALYYRFSEKGDEMDVENG